MKVAILLCAAMGIGQAANYRLLLGVGDKADVRWDGGISAAGRVVKSWKAATQVARGRKGKNAGAQPATVIAAIAADSRVEVKTAQGNFSFAAQEIVFGEAKPFLSGRVLVDRAPETVALTSSAEDQDFPALAQSGDSVYLSYVEFTHANREMETRRAFTEPPKSFDFLAQPAGGDQVMLVRYSKSAKTWSKPMPVSETGQDVMRTAVAVDGEKRVWVIWSARKNGNFDLYARTYAAERWSPEMRVTTNPGTDVNPVAVTDSRGRVWVAWQGFRNGNLEILATAQNGSRFTPEAVVSFSKASDWDPAIAASAKGEVAVSWDTYDKGDYDVYFRLLRLDGGVRMEAPVAVAASRNFEARSSIAYDAQNRLWVAYEASDTKWGKDFGAYETTGIGLYQDHKIKVKCFAGAQALEPVENAAAKMPGRDVAAGIWNRAVKQGRNDPDAVLPDPNLVREAGVASPHPAPLPLNSFPRLAADPNGAMYLTFRTPTAGQAALGTNWAQNLIFYDGAHWKGPIAIPETDYWLDDRAAMATLAPGELLLVTTTDHRNSGQRRNQGEFNADLVASEFQIGGQARPAQMKPATAERPETPAAEAVAESKQVAMLRQYRAAAGGQPVQLLRGEFHRHTEMSGDGGRDGPLIDAYRYMIDAASMDWGGCCDHDNGGGREYSWWIQQKLTDAYKLDGRYVAMFAYERSVKFPEGHRNAVFATRGIRPLPRLPKMDDASPATSAPDTQMLYRYLKQFNGIVASHTSGSGMGTDWRDNDPMVEPVVEIYQGDRQNYEMPGAPRSDRVPAKHPGFVSLALKKGYRLGFQASSDHISTHMSYCNLWVTEATREGVMEAFRKRRIYGATDNILADVRCAGHFMGEEFAVNVPPSISVKLVGTAPFAKVQIIKDGEYVYTSEPKEQSVNFAWKDNAAVKGKTSFYYVRGEQQDGELVWVSPMWIEYR